MQSLSVSNSEKKRCAIYTRVSTIEQVKDGFGLDFQARNCRAMSVVKGWDIVEIYEDKGISGTKRPKDRPGLKRLIQDAQDGKFDALIFYRLDRIGRNSSIVVTIITYLSRWGISIVSCQENIDTSTPAGIFVLKLFSNLAELEKENINTKLKEGAERRREKDGEVGGILPYGYRRINNKIALNPEQVEIIRYIFGERLKGVKLLDIANNLNDKNVVSPKGSLWYKSTVSSIISKKEIYLGGSRNRSDFCWFPILDDSYREAILYKPHKTKKLKNITCEDIEVDKIKKDKDIRKMMEKEGYNVGILD